MTWKILDLSEMSFEEAHKIMDDVVTRECNWADDPTEDIQQAWDRIQDLARKGLVAEKYIKEWGKE